MSGSEAADCLSGLLIGCEVAAALDGVQKGTNITIVAEEKFKALYGAAVEAMGHMASTFDADLAVRTGLLRAACQFWPVVKKTERAASR
jgi:2-dehydro-3-deoxygalactonokinase